MWYIITRIRRDRKAESSGSEQRAFLGEEVFRAKRCRADSGIKFKPFKHPCNRCFTLVNIFSINLNFQGELLHMPAITQALKGQEIQSLNHWPAPGCIFLTLLTGQPSRDRRLHHRKYKWGPSSDGPHHELAHPVRERGLLLLP